MYNYYQEYNFSPDEILVYLRKSRSDDPLLTVEEVLARHETILNEWAEKYIGSPIPQQNKFREVVSGETIDDRPEVQKLLRLIESPKYKAILIVEVQRLSRGDLEDAGRLIKLLRYTNTVVITPQKIYDLSNEYDRDFFERELKRGNEFLEYQKKIMLRGRLLSVSQGNYIGQTAPYGYRKIWVQDGKKKFPTLEIIEDEATVVRTIFDLYTNKNMGITNIAHYLDRMNVKPPKGNVWSAASLRDIIINIHYVGKVKWNFRKTVKTIEDGEIIQSRPKSKTDEYLVYDGKHEAIISQELFDAAQAKNGKNPRVKPSNELVNAFAGILHCSCGYAMILRKYTKNGKTLPPRLMCNNQTHCRSGSCEYSEIEELTAQAIKEQIHNFDLQIKNLEEQPEENHEILIKSIRKRIKELDEKELAQWEAQTNADPLQRMPPEVFKKLNERLQKDRLDAKQALAHAMATMPNTATVKEKRAQFAEALRALKDNKTTAKQKNTLLKACIEDMTYTRAKPERNICDEPNQNNGWNSQPIQLITKLKI